MTDWPLQCSHIKQWIFKNSEEIYLKRKEVHEAAVVKFLKNFPDAEAPCLEDSIRLIRYLAYQLNRLCATVALRPVIQETAGYFFNRFYMSRSIIEYDPRNILFTCMILAIKAEDYGRKYIFSDIFSKMEGIDTKLLLQLELEVCDAINFNLLVLHTREPLLYLRTKCFEKLKDELKLESSQEKQVQKILWRSVWAHAEALCIAMQETDIPLLYTPSQMAVAAFLHYGRSHLNQLINIDHIVRDILCLDEHPSIWESVKKVVDDIAARSHGLCKQRQLGIGEVEAMAKIISHVNKNVWLRTKNTSATLEKIEDSN